MIETFSELLRMQFIIFSFKNTDEKSENAPKIHTGVAHKNDRINKLEKKCAATFSPDSISAVMKSHD